MTIKVKTPVIYPIIVPTDKPVKTYNCFIVQHDGKLFLVDAGIRTKETWQTFLNVLNESGFTLKDLDAIVLTHHHIDHVGIVDAIVKRHPIPVYVHRLGLSRVRRDSEYFETNKRFFKDLYRKMGCEEELIEEDASRLDYYIDLYKDNPLQADFRLLEEGDTIFGFKVHEFPGHSLDQITLLHEETGKMFVGDHLIKHMASNAIVDFDENEARIRSLVVYEAMLKKIRNFPITTAYSGHGEEITDVPTLVDKKLKRIRDKGLLIYQLLHQPKTPAEVAREIYRGRYKTTFGLVMSEIIGHIDRLEQMNQVRKYEHNGMYYYGVNKQRWI